MSFFHLLPTRINPLASFQRDWKRITARTASILSLSCLITPAPIEAQQCVAPPAGIVSWWGAEGTADDEAGLNPGSLQAGATFSSGEVGQAFFFTAGAHVRVTDSASLHFTNAMTVEAWVNPAVHGAYHEIVSKWDFGGSGGKSYDFAAQPDGKAYLVLCADGNDGFDTSVSTTNALPLNVWTHLAATYDGSIIRIYVNGNLQAAVSYTHGIFPGADDLGIGGTVGLQPAGQAANAFEGMLDEVTLYNRALSASELQQIANAGASGKCEKLTAPSITADLTNQTALAGSQVVFAIGATGWFPPAYQWQFNHTDLTNETNATLVLNVITTNQAGIYSVTLSNSEGSVSSTDATLTVTLPACSSPLTNLVSWLPGEGDAFDSAGGAQATLQGGIGFGPGEVGQGFNFDGVNDYVSLAATTNIDVGQSAGMTIECWIKPNDTLSQHALVEWNNGSGSLGVHLWMSVGAQGALYANLVDTSGSIHAFSAPGGTITTNSFQHVALTYDKATGLGKLYRNGVGIMTNSLGTFTPRTGYPLYLGQRPSGGSAGAFYRGTMDEFSLYNRALTLAEIQNIYNSQTLGKCALPPGVVVQPSPQRVKVGTNVTFSARIRGTSAALQWLFKGTNVPGATNSSLTLSNVQPSNSGNYALRVTNLLGSVSAFGNSIPLTNSPASFGGPVTVALQNAYTNGYIFYTLDGSAPTFASTQYTEPFVVSQAVILRALGYSADFFQSGELDPVTILIPPSYTLTASSAGGGTISFNPPGGTYLSNSVVTLNGTPASGWVFLQWLGDATGNSASTNISVTRNKSVQAVFGTTLTTTAAGGGSVTLNPPGGIYPYGTIVWLSAVPQSGNFFGIWGNAASGNVNPLSFGVTNANQTVSSLFSAVGGGQAGLTVVPVGNGRVTVNPRANVYSTGASVTITATPDANQSFLGWSGDASGSQNPLSLTMNQTKTIFANFSHKPSLSIKAPFEGVKPEGFVMTISGDYGGRFEVDGSSNLVNWTVLGVVTNSYGSFEFIDSAAVNLPRRFYRSVMLP